ncbi:MAG: hypothetical protein ABIU54_12760, partial [Candidatus Eisenbacteria bacterium]
RRATAAAAKLAAAAVCISGCAPLCTSRSLALPFASQALPAHIRIIYPEGHAMRTIVSVLLLPFAVAVAQAQPAAGAPSHSADILLRVHPLAWRAPISTVPLSPGLRLEPETGESSDLGLAGATAVTSRATNPLAGIPISVRADGSRFAILAGKLRSYSVVYIGTSGQLQQDCVQSQEEALEMVGHTPPSRGR